LAYEWAVHSLLRENQTVKDLHPGLIMVCGAVGGYGMWIPVYPIDAIKSKIQTDGFGAAAKYRGIADCVAQTYAAGGIAGFYRGFLPCLLRAAPVNASTFFAFEVAMRLLGRD
jgi:solute carrier family 25 (mitochondrial carnitine/acylcarnitine transporter), member 20/29